MVFIEPQTEDEIETKRRLPKSIPFHIFETVTVSAIFWPIGIAAVSAR